MSGKRGRKCSIKTCDSYQHTHKHLSFFRFPKEPERCRIWIEKTQRFDLLDKPNVHEERICQLHFEPSVFINESKNRLHQSAFPTLYLTSRISLVDSDLVLNGIPLNLFNIQDHKFLNMSRTELLYHAQMAAANNLTITAVPSSKPKVNNVQNALFQEPLNLSKPPVKCSQPSIEPPVLMKPEKLNKTPDEIKPATVQPEITKSNREHVFTPPANVNGIATNTGGTRRPRQIFSQEQEDQLAIYVRETSNYYSGLSSKEVRIMAYVYGVCNQVEMPTGWHEVHQASFDWCVGFIKRTKLPPTMITGISAKGKPRILTNNNNGTTSLPNPNNFAIKTNMNNNSNATPIEID